LLNPLRKMVIGAYLINCNLLVTLSKNDLWKEKVGVTHSDLNYKDKQNQSGTLK
jgi:hypothetical protein